MFIDVLDCEAIGYPRVNFLAHNTIYLNVIQSVARNYGEAHMPRAHFGVGGLPERMIL